MPAHAYTLAELLIVAAAEAWRGNGEVLASGIGVVPRLAASLAKLTHSPELMMTDAEAYLVEEPVPLGPRGDYRPKHSGYMSFARVFDCVWGGKRHVMIGPIQIDRFGQTNLSGIGEVRKPKVQMLGMRGLPGNSISHPSSMFVPSSFAARVCPGRSRHRGRRGLQPGALARGGERGARGPAPHRDRPLRHGLQRRGARDPRAFAASGRQPCPKCRRRPALRSKPREALPTTPPPTSEQLEDHPSS